MSVKDHTDLRKGTSEALSLVVAFYEAKKRDNKRFKLKEDGFKFNELMHFSYDEKELGPQAFEDKKGRLRYSFGRLYARGIMHRVQCEQNRKQHMYTSNYDLRQLKTILARNPA